MRHQISFTLGKPWLVLFDCAWPMVRRARGTHSSLRWGNSLAGLCLFAWPSSGSCKFFARSPTCRCLILQYLILTREALLFLHLWQLEELKDFPLSLLIFYSDCLIWSVVGFIVRLRRVPSHLRNWSRSKVDLIRCVSGIQAIEASPWQVLFFLRLRCWLCFHLELYQAAAGAA